MPRQKRTDRPAFGAEGGVALLERRDLPIARRERAALREAAVGLPRRQEQGRRRFVSALAHEVRAPLAVIRNYSDVLLNCPPTDEAERRSFLQAIAEESDRLNRLLELLNLIDKLESGSTTHDPAPVDLGETLQGAVLSLHPLSSRKRIEIEVEVGEAPLVWGEPNLLARACVELVENAVKFSLPGGRVRARIETGNGEVTVAVEDEGIGIPAGTDERLYEKFYQAASPPDTVSPRGAGLGLALVRLTADRHDGRVRFERKERGVRFTLSLPVGEFD